MLRDKWRLISLLGIGGMASVYEATHRNGSRAAVKILHTELSSDKHVRERFLREGYAANLVGHDGAVKVLDDDTTEDGALFLVTELLEGSTLEDLAHRAGGRLRWDELRPFVDQLLDVLAMAHDKGIVHRDVKPDNVFVTRAGRVKVLDFGIARIRETQSTGTTTQAGTTMGSPAYMAPEQARALWDEVDHRTDLWAVGATLFTLLSGRLVHEGRTANELLLSAMTQRAPSLASVTGDVPPAVVEVVDRALAYDRADRWTDAREMRKAVLEASPLGPEVPRTVIRVPRASQPAPAMEASSHPTFLAVETGKSPPGTDLPARRKTALLALGGAVVAAVAVLLLVFAHPSSPRPAPAVAVATPDLPAALPIAEPLAPVPPAASSVAPVVLAEPSPGPTPSAAAPSQAPAVPRSPGPGHPGAPPQAAAAGAPPKGACNPPYVIDPATGRRKWKMECL